jgi:hypothetical protein
LLQEDPGGESKVPTTIGFTEGQRLINSDVRAEVVPLG